jgi:hypothetical protein
MYVATGVVVALIIMLTIAYGSAPGDAKLTPVDGRQHKLLSDTNSTSVLLPNPPSETQLVMHQKGHHKGGLENDNTTSAFVPTGDCLAIDSKLCP